MNIIQKQSTKGVYSHYNTETLLEAFHKGPERIKEIISGLTEQDFKDKPISGKWSIGEIIIHLTDSEIVGACRLRQALCNHPDDMPSYSQDIWAEKMNYQNQSIGNIHESIELFSLLRSTTFQLYNNCTKKDWEKIGIHPERGAMTIRELLELYADHSERHIEQIIERRKILNKPREIEIILKDRLY